MNTILFYILQIILAILLYQRTDRFFDCRKEAAAAKAQSEDGQTVVKQRIPFFENPSIRIVLLFLAMGIFALLLKTLGFLICGYVLMVAIMLIMNVKGLLRYIIFPIATVALLYIIFKFALGMPLPAGILGI